MLTFRRYDHRLIPVVLLFLPASILFLASSTYAQTNSPSSEAIRVILGEDTMVPGYQVTVPCELETVGDVKVGRIELKVTFPAAKISFDSIRRGLISDQIDAQISYEIEKNETDSAFSVIKLNIAPKENVSIPQGFLFDLVFVIGLIRVVAEPPPVASCFFYMH